MLIKHRGIVCFMLLLCLFLSLLILNILSNTNNTNSKEVLENSVTEETKFIPENYNSILVNVYGNSNELNSTNTKADVVLDASIMEKIESLSDKAVVVARGTLVENLDKGIKPAPENKKEIVEESTESVEKDVESVEEVSNYISPVEVEVDSMEETKVNEKEETVSTPPKSEDKTIINVVPSIDNENNVVLSDSTEDVIQTTRGKITFTYDPNVVYVNTENIESRFAVFAPNDDYNKVVKALAQMAFGEARGCADTEIAATIWCVLNRYDAGYANSIFKVVSAKGQFHGYSPNHKVYDDIYEITKDVIARWVSEKEGVTNVGRILPSDYLWFAGDGKHNYYRNEYRTSNRWDWSLPTPYIDWE